MKYLHKIKIGVPAAVGAVVLALLSQASLAGHGDADAVAFGGTTACGGNHFNRVAGNEGQRSSYILRNYNDSDSIKIERIRMVDATGAVLFDSAVSGMPTFFNGVLGAGDDSLEPHQTAQLRSQDVLSAPLGSSQRPIQTLVDWTAEKKVLLLDAVLVRVSRDRDIVTGQLGDERGRHLLECRHVKINNGKGQNKED
jgi:hypothetical protein